MDNLALHKNAETLAWIAVGAETRFLPLHLPAPNPIELAWSKLRAHLRKVGARASEALYAAIAEGLKMPTAQNARGWFRHCGCQG